MSLAPWTGELVAPFGLGTCSGPGVDVGPVQTSTPSVASPLARKGADLVLSHPDHVDLAKLQMLEGQDTSSGWAEAPSALSVGNRRHAQIARRSVGAESLAPSCVHAEGSRRPSTRSDTRT